MKVEIETLGANRKLLRIEIPAEKVNEELESRYEDLRKRASVPGFRRGHVPHRILKARFSEYIKNEAIQHLVPVRQRTVPDRNGDPCIGLAEPHGALAAPADPTKARRAAAKDRLQLPYPYQGNSLVLPHFREQSASP